MRPGPWKVRSGLSSSSISVLAALAATSATLSGLVPGAAWAGPGGGPAAARAWHVYMAEAQTDTLAASLAEVVPAAQRAFTDDHWQISDESTSERVVTGWKAFHHPLARLLLGDLRARCVVDMRPLGSERTLVRFQGGMASQGNLESNPAFAAAQVAYRNAVQGWYRDVREAVADERRLSPVGMTQRSGMLSP